jgi:hypothetical protein
LPWGWALFPSGRSATTVSADSRVPRESFIRLIWCRSDIQPHQGFRGEMCERREGSHASK